MGKVNGTIFQYYIIPDTLAILISPLQCICPQLIVLRVVSGKSWTKGTLTRVHSDIDFHKRAVQPDVSQMRFAERYTLPDLNGGDTTLAGSVEKNSSSSQFSTVKSEC